MLQEQKVLPLDDSSKNFYYFYSDKAQNCYRLSSSYWLLSSCAMRRQTISHAV